MKIDIIKLLDLYDVYRPERAPHVTAITTFLGVELILGIVRHYFEQQQYECRITASEPAVADSRLRLDRWFVVNREGREIFYQTEVKNWSSYTTGVPRTLTLGMNARQLNNYAFAMHKKQWNHRTGTFTDYDNLAKVLMPTVEPADFRPGISEVRPLVCYWYPITNSDRTKLTSHFFTLDCQSKTFTEVDIFSASLYLRHLASTGITSINVDLGNLNTTIHLLRSFLQLP